MSTTAWYWTRRSFAVDAAPLLTRATVQSLNLRVMGRAEFAMLEQLRRDNFDWLKPWEATSPNPERMPSYRGYVSQMLRLKRRGQQLPLLVVADGQPVGYVVIGEIVRGSANMAAIGYWIARSHAGRGITTAAVARALDICIGELGLHRVEICIRPENAASLRVVQKLGLRFEGMREKYLHIDGDWRDHEVYVMRAELWPENGCVGRLIFDKQRRT